MNYLDGMVASSLFTLPDVADPAVAALTVLLIGFMSAVEWNGRAGKHGLEQLGAQWPRPLRWTIYAVVVFLMGMFMQTDESPFIYFQF